MKCGNTQHIRIMGCLNNNYLLRVAIKQLQLLQLHHCIEIRLFRLVVDRHRCCLRSRSIAVSLRHSRSTSQCLQHTVVKSEHKAYI